MAIAETTDIVGTPEQLVVWLGGLAKEKRYRITEVREHETEMTQTPITRRVSAMGKYAFVGGGSEEFAREKQEEIEREDGQR